MFYNKNQKSLYILKYMCCLIAASKSQQIFLLKNHGINALCRFSHRVAMSIVCACAIAENPLPGALETSGLWALCEYWPAITYKKNQCWWICAFLKLVGFWYFANQPTVDKGEVNGGTVCCYEWWRLWQETGERWQVTGDRWQVICDKWHGTCGTWHAKCDMLHIICDLI